jgi:histidine phosphotransfer protein HptB
VTICKAILAAENLLSTTPPMSTLPGPSAPGVLDAEALARLHELDPGGKAGLVPRVLSTYTQSLQRLLEQLQQAREQSDTQTQRHVVHTLKSSSASVGALKLAALCADTEGRLREGLSEGLAQKFDELDCEGRHVLAGLRAA